MERVKSLFKIALATFAIRLILTALKCSKVMNENLDLLTKGDLALYETRRYGRGYAYDDGGCCSPMHYEKRKNALQGASITGVVLGGTALAVAVAIGWGVNAASKARARGNERTIDKLSDFALRESERRENWESKHSPSTVQYVDVQTGAGAFSGSAANAAAYAAAVNNNSGINSAIGGCNFLRVARYSAPKPCGCDSCDE